MFVSSFLPSLYFSPQPLLKDRKFNLANFKAEAEAEQKKKKKKMSIAEKVVLSPLLTLDANAISIPPSTPSCVHTPPPFPTIAHTGEERDGLLLS